MNKTSGKEFRDFYEATRALSFWAHKLLELIDRSNKKTGEVKKPHKNGSSGNERKDGTTGG